MTEMSFSRSRISAAISRTAAGASASAASRLSRAHASSISGVSGLRWLEESADRNAPSRAAASLKHPVYLIQTYNFSSTAGLINPCDGTVGSTPRTPRLHLHGQSQAACASPATSAHASDPRGARTRASTHKHADTPPHKHACTYTLRTRVIGRTGRRTISLLGFTPVACLSPRWCNATYRGDLTLSRCQLQSTSTNLLPNLRCARTHHPLTR